MSLFYVKGSKLSSMDVFMKPFRIDTWMSITFYITLLVTGYVAIALGTQPRIKSTMLKEAFWWAQKSSNFCLRSLIGKRVGSKPVCHSTRICFFVIIVCGFFIITLYRAILVAFVAVNIDIPPVNSLNDIRNSDYLLSVARHSAYDDIFIRAKPGTEEYKLERMKRVVRFNGSVNKYIDKMISNEKSTENVVLFSTIMGGIFNNHYPCYLDYIQSAPKSTKVSAGMIFKHNWPYTKLLNFHLLTMKENGMFDRLLEPYMNRVKKPCPGDQKIRSVLKQPKPLEASKIVFLCTILLAGLVSASILLVVEILYQRSH